MEVVLIFSLLVLLPSSFLETNAKVDSVKEYVYIVDLSVTPPSPPGPDAFNIKLLSSVLGSEEAAKKAFLYSYDVFGFAAKLTPKHAKRLKKQRDVRSVKRDVGYPLDGDLRTASFAPQESGL